MSTARVFLDNEGESALVDVRYFDALSRGDAADLIRACCPSRRWVREVVSGRPYGSLRQLIAGSEDVLTDLSSSDIGEAVAVGGALSPRPAGADREVVRAELQRIVRLALVTTFR